MEMVALWGLGRFCSLAGAACAWRALPSPHLRWCTAAVLVEPLTSPAKPSQAMSCFARVLHTDAAAIAGRKSPPPPTRSPPANERHGIMRV